MVSAPPRVKTAVVNGVVPQTPLTPDVGVKREESFRILEDPTLVEIGTVHDHFIHDLQHDGIDFYENFCDKVIEPEPRPEFYKFGDGADLRWEHIYKSRQGNLTILHQIILLVQKKPAVTPVAKKFIDILVYEEPKLIKVRESQTEKCFNALELAVDSGNCHEIIQSICKGGIASSPIAPNLAHKLERLGELRSQNLQLQTKEGMSPDTLSQDKRIAPEKSISPEVRWKDLKRDNKDTCLHIAIRKKQYETASYLLDRMVLAGEQDVILKVYGENGLRPLHIAVEFKDCCEQRIKLAAHIIDVYPDALSLERGTFSTTDTKGRLMPLKYFIEERESIDKRDNVHGANAWKAPKNHDRVSKEMENLLRLSCMRHHGHKRDLITKLLDSKGQIHLDLNPRREVTQQLLDYMNDHMKFDSYLQYVFVPKLRVVGVSNKSLESEEWWNSLSRKDYVYIFRWLKDIQNVERILSIVVEDDSANPHSDEAIEEALKGFDVEVWNWVKLDMCVDTIRTAAENVRDLTLHWSGNRTVLKSWAARDGLAMLQNLEKVRIMIPLSMESAMKTQTAVQRFRDDLKHSWEVRQQEIRAVEKAAGTIEKNRRILKAVPTPEFEMATTQTHFVKRLSDKEKKEKDRKEHWSRCTDDLALTVKKYMNSRMADKNGPLTRGDNHADLWINVAIIDDGVDPERDDIGNNIESGETFYDSWGHWPGFYQSSYGHGHLMARHIKQLCPKVRLHIAKLNELWGDDKPQITAESAAKAIDWAIEKGVDIISMSWTIETPQESAVNVLELAVKRALDLNILLFCASNDQGRTTTGIPYPAKFDPRIFTIGSATALGNADEATQKSVKYIAPGADDLDQLVHGADSGSSKPLSGSSIATARCAGLAALILQCMMLVCFSRFAKTQIRTHENMKKMFDLMVDRSYDEKNNYLGVWTVLEAAKNQVEISKNEEWSIIYAVANEFNSVVKGVDFAKFGGQPPSLVPAVPVPGGSRHNNASLVADIGGQQRAPRRKFERKDRSNQGQM